MAQIPRTPLRGLTLLILLGLMVTACGAPAPQVVRETVVVTAESQPVRETVIVTTTPGGPTATPARQAWTTPHPIIGDLQFRQAFAYCTDRRELIRSVYPFLSEQEQDALLMNTFLPQGHWALAPDNQITVYPFDPEKGKQLLEEAGWTSEGEGQVRTNAEGESLSVKFSTTDAQFRQTWAAVLEQQLLENCGIQMIRTHAPGSWFFGDKTGLQVRDFELGAYAWVGQADPQGYTLYACNQIPLPSNNWEGQNYMGWCNETADRAVFRANNTLSREERIEQYRILQQEFTKDMVSLPLFNRFEAAAADLNLQNFRDDATIDHLVANVDEWEMTDGSDTVVLGFTQEPDSMFLLVQSASVANAASSLLQVRAATSYEYDYQPDAMEELPTLENGIASNRIVEVTEGDKVWSVDSEAVELAPGVEVLNADGEVVTYEDGTIEMHQLTVPFTFTEGLTWEDGTPVTKADFELAYKVNCDPTSGSVSYTICNSIEKVDYPNDNTYVITYLPGAQWAEYFVQTIGQNSNLYAIGAYPAHQELSDGRKLVDVPPAEWSTLPEVAEKPLSYGPYKLVEWQKGQRMVFEANPHYYKGEPAIKTIIIQFFSDTQQSVAQLLTGEVDVLARETLGAGPELETVLQAGEERKIQVIPVTSPTWEHIDFNLFVP